MDNRVVDDPNHTLQRGASLLGQLLLRHGFVFEILGAGEGSGGTFAFGHFRRGDRRVELHFRYSLGLVRYHLGSRSMSHEDFMYAVQGKLHASKYPGFSGDPMDGFRDLLSDLEAYGTDFLSGTDDCLLRRIEQANPLANARPRLPE
jgi:hypothetical protein